MPPPRWIVRVIPLVLPRTLKRLREERDWTQKEVEAMLAVSGNPVGRQNSLSRYETGERQPEPNIVDALSALYEQPQETLMRLWWQDQRARAAMEGVEIPGPSVAIPDEPVIVRLFERVRDWEDEQIDRLTQSADILEGQEADIAVGVERQADAAKRRKEARG